MAEQGRLGGCSGDDRDLQYVRVCRGWPGRADKPTVSLSSKRIFILAAEVPVAAVSPTDTILVM